MIIELVVNCVNCDAEIAHKSLHVDDEGIASVNVDEFSQTDWLCPECGHTTCIGDVDMIDEEDLFDCGDDKEEEEDEYDPVLDGDDMDDGK